MNSHGYIDEGSEMMPGGGVRWREFNPSTGIRTTYTMNGNVLVRDTEYVNTDLMLDANAEQANDLTGARWGNGRIYARVPMNLAYAGYLGEAQAAGDKKAMAKWFNDPDHAKFRIMGGRV